MYIESCSEFVFGLSKETKVQLICFYLILKNSKKHLAACLDKVPKLGTKDRQGYVKLVNEGYVTLKFVKSK